jgi:hypothetical protein
MHTRARVAVVVMVVAAATTCEWNSPQRQVSIQPPPSLQIDSTLAAGNRTRLQTGSTMPGF